MLIPVQYRFTLTDDSKMTVKPMARFHLPLASEEETIYRATTMYLLAQYFLREVRSPRLLWF
jgi:hypothetical protein